MLVLFIVGLGVFLAPFAFPTPPPIVTGFQATRQFSPNADGSREVARVAVRLNEASVVTVEIQDRSGKRWKGLIDAQRPKEMVRLAWDGTDDTGNPVPDGRYVVSLRARAGKKRWNASKVLVVDRIAPPLGNLGVQSAALAGPGDGECRVAATALDRGELSIEASPSAGTAPVARFGPKIVRAGETALWNWDGKRADGGPTPPGLYTIRATLTDVPKNRSEQSATCWVGHLVGTAIPARPTLGARVGIRLQDTAGTALRPSTPVSVTIARRVGDPGSATRVVGPAVGARVSGPLGNVRIPLPRRIPPARLWLVVTTDGGRTLIPLRP
jgi:hypothetical protein